VNELKLLQNLTNFGTQISRTSAPECHQLRQVNCMKFGG
jgi:hypothetical protein